MKKKHSEIMWAIKGIWENEKPFFYVKTYPTRKEAISNHTRGQLSWRKARRNGDRAVKVRVTEI